MVLIDTNVLVFLFLRGERTEEARALFAADNDWRSDSFLLVEFSNVLVTYVRSRELEPREATRLLDAAEKLMQTRVLNGSHAEAFATANQFLVSAYDGRFLALALRLQRRLVTEDAGLRRKAPELTQSIEEALRHIAL